jgi:hypothetical protein
MNGRCGQIGVTTTTTTTTSICRLGPSYQINDKPALLSLSVLLSLSSSRASVGLVDW